MRGRYAFALAIRSEQINTYAPQFRPMPNPVHGVMLPNHGCSGGQTLG
jgi:hypothetical protein